MVRTLVPYVAGEQPTLSGLIKLNTNENPYPPSPHVVRAIADAAQEGLERYPDPESMALRRVLAEHHRLEPGQIFVGNGSDEVLALAFYAYFQQGLPLLMPDVTYSFYAVYCQLYGIPVQVVPLDAAMRLQVGAYTGQAAGVVVANPNAPTGVALALADIEALLRLQPDCVVLVDEAYVDFGCESAMCLINKYPNLLVVHTLSKSRSLAGLRVGFAAGSRHLIDGLERVKNSFNSYPLDRLAQAGAAAAYGDLAHFEWTRHAVMQSRDHVTAELQAMGFDVLPSAANFVLARHPAHDAAALAAGLRDKAVLVRHFKLVRVDQHLRISIGTPAKCEIMLAVMRTLTAPHPATSLQ